MNALLLSLLLQAGTPMTQEHALVAGAPVDTTAAVSIHARLTPDTVYVGQQALYQLIVFVDERWRDRVRRMEAIPPEMRGMMAYEAPQRSGVLPTRVIGRRRFEPYIYQRPIFPLTAGELVVPPSRLVYAMPVSASFFSRVESMELWSDSARIVVVDPPLAGRPYDYRGAIGRMSAEARIDATSSRVGDPLTLMMRITGRGNVKLFPRPDIEIPWASAVPAGDRIEQGPDSLRIGGTKEFRWVITPRLPGTQRLPALRYPYFDPESGQYGVAETRPRAVLIEPGTLAQLDTLPAAQPPLPLRSVYRGALGRPPHGTPPFWVVIALAPLPALVLAVRRRPVQRRRPKRVRGGQLIEQLDASHATPADIRRAFLQATAMRLHVSAIVLGDPVSFERHARRAGVTAQTASQGAALVESLNAAAFGPDGAHSERARERALRVYGRVDAEAVRRSARITPLAIIVTAVALPVGAALALDGADDVRRFAGGVAAYESGEYADAARAFEDIALRVPRAADAWANLGTASYAAADTARAAWGWQRALRLEPLARDVRDRMVILGDFGSGGASVPAIPVVALALVAAAVWLVGWSVTAVRIWRREGVGTQALVIVFSAALIAGAAWSLDRRVAGDSLAVVAHNEPLRFLPALGAERQGVALVGSVARIEERSGGWVRISASGRRGWVEQAALLPLARD